MACASSAKNKGRMGVRLREYLSSGGGRARRGEAGEIVGLDQLLLQIGKIGDFPKDMSKELRQGNRKIGQAVSRKVKPQIPVSGEGFKVYQGSRGRGRAKKGQGKVRWTVPSGTLRRSIGVKNSRGSRINVWVGPRAGGALKNDGYFAGIVESGHVGGRNRSVGSKNYNKIVPALARLRPMMERLMVAHFRRTFNKFKL